MINPIIGITCGHEWEDTERYYVNEAYIRNIVNAGGVPILIPYMESAKLEIILDSIDGLLVPGGVDIDAKLFNQELHPESGKIDPLWDQLDLTMIKGSLVRELPILAICRGCQILNVVCGGTLIQDIASYIKRPVKHEQQAPKWYATHEIKLTKDTLLAEIFAVEQLRVNSFHHQSVAELAPGFCCSAVASDGVIEAIESTEHKFVIGVQWHPELMVEYYPAFGNLFKQFVNAAGS